MRKIIDFFYKYKLANRVTIIYLIFGVAWILLSDRILSIFVSDATVMAHIQTIKGNAYVLMTAILLWVLIFQGLRHLNGANEQASRSLARYKSHYEQSMIGLLTLDEYLMVREANPRALEMFQGDAAILLGRPISDLFESSEDIEELISEEDTPSAEVRIRCADGRRVHALLSISPVRDADGNLIEYVAYMQEIEELKQYESALLKVNAQLEKRVQDRTRQLEVSNRELSSSLQDQRLLTAQLERTNQDLRNALEHSRKLQDRMVYTERMTSLGNMVAGLAHELNTPLGAAKTSGSFLKQEVLKLKRDFEAGGMTKKGFQNSVESLEESADIIDRNVTNASEMMLRFKQMATDQTRQNDVRMNVLETVENVRTSLKHYLKRKDIRYELNIPSDLTVVYPSGCLSQILNNLFLNAVIHGLSDRDGGTISISAACEENTFQMTFEDDGNGISKENVKRIFEPFFSTVQQADHEQAGAGLGLYLVRSIVQEQMDGEITCQSEEGKFTRFTLTASCDQPE